MGTARSGDSLLHSESCLVMEEVGGSLAIEAKHTCKIFVTPPCCSLSFPHQKNRLFTSRNSESSRFIHIQLCDRRERKNFLRKQKNRFLSEYRAEL
jgi:hypothetical protein